MIEFLASKIFALFDIIDPAWVLVLGGLLFVWLLLSLVRDLATDAAELTRRDR